MPPKLLEDAAKYFGNLNFTTLTVESATYRYLTNPDNIKHEQCRFGNNVESQNNEMQNIIPPLKNVPKKKYTHFISLPLDSGLFTDNMNHVLSNIFIEKYSVNKSVLQQTSKLHLTLCLLSLSEKLLVSKCCHILSCLTPKIQAIVNNDLLHLHFKGLTTWDHHRSNKRNRRTKNTVLFTCPVQPLESLQKLNQLFHEITNCLRSEKIIDIIDLQQETFTSCNETEKENVLTPFFHLTLVNTKYGSIKTKTSDFNTLLDDMKNYDWGIATVSQLHLSCLYPTNSCQRNQGYYSSEVIIPFK